MYELDHIPAHISKLYYIYRPDLTFIIFKAIIHQNHIPGYIRRICNIHRPNMACVRLNFDMKRIESLYSIK